VRFTATDSTSHGTYRQAQQDEALDRPRGYRRLAEESREAAWLYRHVDYVPTSISTMFMSDTLSLLASHLYGLGYPTNAIFYCAKKSSACSAIYEDKSEGVKEWRSTQNFEIFTKRTHPQLPKGNFA